MNSCAMKKLPFLLGIIVLFSSWGVTLNSAWATDGVWNTTAATENWSTAGDWLNSIIADGAGATADFSQINPTTNLTINLDTSRSIGHLIFGDTDTSTAATVTLAPTNSSIFTLDNTGGSGAPKITVNALGTGQVATVSVPLAGTQGLIKDGVGTLNLSGANTFTGLTQVTAGVLRFGSTTALQNSTLDYNNDGGTIDFGTQTAATLAGLQGAQNLTLNNSAANPGAVTLTIGNTNVTSSYSGSLSGLGSVTKTGTGIVTLSGNNSFGGAINANAGTLVLTGSNTTRGQTTVANGAVLRLGNANVLQNSTVLLNSTTANSLAFASGGTDTIGALLVPASGAGAFALQDASANAVTLVVGSGDLSSNGAFSGVISGSGGINKIGKGIQTLSGTNTYVGGVTFTGGELSIAADANLGSATDALTFSGGVLQVTGTAVTSFGTHTVNYSTFNGGLDIATGNTFTLSNSISGNGSFSKFGAGTVVFTTPNSYSGGTLVSAGTLQGDTSSLQGTITNRGTVVFNQAGDGTFAGSIIHGGGAVTLQGTGTVTFTGANTYSGTTTFSGSNVLNIANANAVQFSTIAPNNDNVLTFAPGITTVNMGNLNGFGAFALSTTSAQNVNLIVGGNNSASTNYSSTISGGGTLTKVGTGTLTLGANQTYTGATTVNLGTLAVSGNFASSSLTLGGGTFSLSNSTGANLTGGVTLNAGGGALNASSVSTVNLALNAIARNVGGTIDFTLPGSGNFITTSTANTAGTILGGWATVGGADWAVNSAGNIVGLSTLGTNYTPDVYTAGTDTNVTISNSLSGATTNSMRFDSLSGPVTLTLSGTNVISSGGILETLNAGSNNIAINGGTLVSGNGQDLIVNQFNNTSGATMTIGSVIANNGGTTGLTKNGSGTLILTGANTYTGNTSINGGILQINAGGVLPMTGTLTNNGTLAMNNGSSLTLNSAVGGSGTINMMQGNLTLDFTTSALTNDILGNNSSVTMGGGTFRIQGGAGGVTNSQTLNSFGVTAGRNVLSLDSGTGTMNLTIRTTIPNPATGASLRIDAPASGTIFATGNQTGSSLIAGTNNGARKGDWITWGLNDFVGTDGSQLFPLAQSNVLGVGYNIPGDTNGGWFDANGFASPKSNTSTSFIWDVQQTALTTGGNTTVWLATRFNQAHPTTITVNVANWGCGGWLVTPNVGANNITLMENGANTAAMVPTRDTSGVGEVFFWQNDTQNEMIMNVVIGQRDATSNFEEPVKVGQGTLVLNPMKSDGSAALPNAFNGPTWVNEGTIMFNQNGAFGIETGTGGGGGINLNGGGILANPTITLAGAATNTATLENSATPGTNQRPISLLSGGGTISAATGKTLNVTGIVSGIGNLTIGSGALTGTGAGTANTTEIDGNGLVSLSGANTYTGTTSVVSGATLNINGINALGGANYNGITVNGATLQYASSSLNGSTDLSTPTISGRAPFTIGSSGATIDTNGNAVVWANSIGAGGSGSLRLNDTATNPGKLTLGGNNSYSGGTTVSRGTLLVNNTTGSGTGSGAVTVNSGGILGGTGTISGLVTVNNGGILAPGASVGTLHVGSLSIVSGSILNYEFNGTTAGHYDQTIVTANNGFTLDGSGTEGFNLFVENGTSQWSSPGTYELIQYSGSLQGTPLDSTWTTAAGNNPHVLNRVPGLTYAFNTSTNPGFLDLVIGGTPPSAWNFNGDGNWSENAKWSNGSPNGVGVSATLGTGTSVTINAATANVTLDVPVVVGALTFSNSTTSYTVSGTNTLTLNNTGNGNSSIQDGAGSHQISAPVQLLSTTDITVGVSTDTLAISGNLSGSSALNKLGTGTLALSGANNSGYSGTINLGNGTLQVGSSGALGTGGLNITSTTSALKAGASVSINNPITISSGVTANVNTNANTLTLGGAIGETAASGSLSVTGGGTLVLGANSTFSGATTVAAGTTLQLGIASGAGSIPNSAINNSGALVLNRTDTGLAITKSISGSGTLEQRGTGSATLSAANTFSGNTTVTGGTLVVDNTLALQNSMLNYNTLGGSLSFSANVTAATFGGLEGNQSLSLNNAGAVGVVLTVGGNNQAVEYSGGLSGAGGLTKIGTGVLTLSGANAYTGATTVSGGGLLIPATGSLSAGAGTITSNGSNGTTFGIQVNGGSITTTGAFSINSGATGTGGYSQTDGNVNVGAANWATDNQAQGNQFLISGGTFTATSLTAGRTGLSDTAIPGSGSTTSGIYISQGNDVPTVNITGALNLGTNSSTNSTVSFRMDAGNVTVGGPVSIGLNNSGRWSVLDINGGTFTNTDTTTGIQLGLANAGQSELLIHNNALVNVQRIQMGPTGADVGETGSIRLSAGATLFVGSGGIVLGTVPTGTPNYTPDIVLADGILGASADWSSSVKMTLSGTTVQAADATNVPHNITLSGALLSGSNFTKTGAGTLILTGQNGSGGFGSASVNAGALQGNTDGLAGGSISLNDPTTSLIFNQGTVVGNGQFTGFISGNGTVVKTGPGTVTFTGSQSYNGNTNVNQGTLVLNTFNTLNGTPQILLGGGTLNTGGTTQTLNTTTLNLQATSAIDFGNSQGNSDPVTFADSHSIVWNNSALLRISNWTGNTTNPTFGGGVDQLFVGVGGLSGTSTTGQLGQIHFTGYFTGSQILGTGELVPASATLLKRGDVNQDGVVNVADISALMTALTDLTDYENGSLKFAGTSTFVRTNHATPFDALDMADVMDTNIDNAVNNLDIQSEINGIANGGVFGGGGGGGSGIGSGSSIAISSSGSVTAVPEPASFLLLGLALPAIGLTWRRRRRAA